MAFHLHRLGLVGRALREVGYNMHDVADLAAGRTSLKSTDTTEMAKRLGIAEQQLTRDLTEQENRIWAFYRRSAADPKYVWNSARVAWQAAEFSEQQVAQILGIHRAHVWRSASNPHRFILSFHQAARLATALNLQEGPEIFLPSPKGNDPQQSR